MANDLASGAASEIDRTNANVYARHRDNRDGALADYIPKLARVEPDRFDIAVATADGKLFAIGDTEQAFTIQSVSKAFVYCLALELVGRDAVLSGVGVEPSGDAFNAIVFDCTNVGSTFMTAFA